MEKSGNGAGTTWVFNLPNGEPTRCQVEWRPSEAGQDEGKLGLQRSWKTANTKGMADLADLVEFFQGWTRWKKDGDGNVLFLRLWMVQSWVLELSVGGGEVAAGKVGDRLEKSPEKKLGPDLLPKPQGFRTAAQI
ncbi:hypothetical protein VTJ04DRAFT_3961 [Mycothermus thermophilus]|uniref:uncharacterized protein n=1 Tax=Humicola insolens TaxID=85995 RepID=UPI00374491CD